MSIASRLRNAHKPVPARRERSTPTKYPPLNLTEFLRLCHLAVLSAHKPRHGGAFGGRRRVLRAERVAA
jgi:hypothetical protein